MVCLVVLSAAFDGPRELLGRGPGPRLGEGHRQGRLAGATPAARWSTRTGSGSSAAGSTPSPPRRATSGARPTARPGTSSPREAPWKHSDLPMTVVFNDRMWLMGGWYNGRLPGHGASNEVWSSTDGVNWEQATEQAGWSPRLAAGAVVFKGRMWILGGTEDYYFGDDTSLKNDVWSSADGKDWRREIAQRPLVAAGLPRGRRPRRQDLGARRRQLRPAVPGPERRLELVRRRDTGSAVTEHAPWTPRIWFSAVVYRDRIWVLGGWSNNPSKNWGDVWYSRDGKSWDAAPVERRSGRSATSTPPTSSRTRSGWRADTPSRSAARSGRSRSRRTGSRSHATPTPVLPRILVVESRRTGTGRRRGAEPSSWGPDRRRRGRGRRAEPGPSQAAPARRGTLRPRCRRRLLRRQLVDGSQVAPMILEAVRQRGHTRHSRGIAALDRLPLTEQALDGILELLAVAEEDSTIRRLNGAIAKVPVELFVARRSAILDTPHFDRDQVPRLERRHDLAGWSGERLWKELQEFSLTLRRRAGSRLDRRGVFGRPGRGPLAR